jgi:hypothetical protein
MNYKEERFILAHKIKVEGFHPWFVDFCFLACCEAAHQVRELVAEQKAAYFIPRNWKSGRRGRALPP